MNTINKLILPLMGLTINCDMPGTTQELDAMKSVAYVHKIKEAYVNRAAQNMGGRYFKNKSMNFKRIHVALNKKKYIPLATVTPKDKNKQTTPESTTNETIETTTTSYQDVVVLEPMAK